MKYFSALPDIFYNNSLSKNLLTRATIQENLVNHVSQYQPYVSEFGERLENISYAYYGSCDQYWLIALANKIVDPYYDVSLSDSSFDNYIIKKYGSFETAYKTILFYRNNWATVEEVISIAAYNSLPSNQKKYWNPITTNEVNVTGYERKKEDVVINTNQIIVASGTFIEPMLKNERVLRVQSGVETGSGTVSFCNNSTIILKHITGSFDLISGASYTITGETSENIGTISSIDMVNYTIPQDEFIYFSAVTAADYENEKNVQKTNLSMISEGFVEEIESALMNLYPESQ